MTNVKKLGMMLQFFTDVYLILRYRAEKFMAFVQTYDCPGFAGFLDSEKGVCGEAA